MFSLIPRDQAFFQMFQKAARNVIEGSRLLKEMMEDYRNPIEQARQIKEALLHKSAAGRIPPEDDRELKGGLRLGHAEPSHGVHCREARINLGHLTAETACLEPGTK